VGSTQMKKIREASPQNPSLTKEAVLPFRRKPPRGDQQQRGERGRRRGVDGQSGEKSDNTCWRTQSPSTLHDGRRQGGQT